MSKLKELLQALISQVNNSIKKVPQELTPEEQTHVKKNLGISNADWSQNDEADPGYIKNRPFCIQKEIVEDATKGAFSIDNFTSTAGFFGNVWSPFTTSGTVYRVIFDGISYDVILHKDREGLGGHGYLGDPEYTEYPFYIEVINMVDEYSVDITTNDSKTHSIELYPLVDRIIPIDEKFIPDTIVRTSSIEDYILTESDITELALSIATSTAEEDVNDD